MRLTRCALGLLAFAAMLGGGCVPEEEASLAEGEPEPIESSSAALSIYEANPLGNQSVLSPAEGPPITITKTRAWITVPGLSTAVFSHRGDNLAISVSAEMFGTATVWMRALVDGQPAAPSDVKFKIGAENFDGTRAFTFVAPGVSAGQHTVEIQWFVNAGNTISMRDRTLTVNSGSTFFGVGRLAVAAATSGPDVLKTTATWEDMPGLATSITTAAPRAPWFVVRRWDCRSGSRMHNGPARPTFILFFGSKARTCTSSISSAPPSSTRASRAKL